MRGVGATPSPRPPLRGQPPVRRRRAARCARGARAAPAAHRRRGRSLTFKGPRHRRRGREEPARRSRSTVADADAAQQRPARRSATARSSATRSTARPSAGGTSEIVVDETPDRHLPRDRGADGDDPRRRRRRSGRGPADYVERVLRGAVRAPAARRRATWSFRVKAMVLAAGPGHAHAAAHAAARQARAAGAEPPAAALDARRCWRAAASREVDDQPPPPARDGARGGGRRPRLRPARVATRTSRGSWAPAAGRARCARSSATSPSCS